MTSKVPDNYEVPSFPSLSNPYLTFEFRKILYYKSGMFSFFYLNYINILYILYEFFFYLLLIYLYIY